MANTKVLLDYFTLNIYLIPSSSINPLGVYGLPKCPGVNHTLCEYARELLDIGAYLSWIQDFLVQAEYWHVTLTLAVSNIKDPFNEPEYLAKSVFLPDINNEGQNKNETYKEHMISLNSFTLVKFNEGL